MKNALGLSIGTANLVAAPAGATPTVRRAVLTVFPHRPPEVGVPLENAHLNEPGLALSGFVERVGDPVPLVASDGSTHPGERLLADALEALTRAASPSRPPEVLGAAVPAHWHQSVIDTLRTAVASKTVLSPHGQPMPLMSDAVAALTSLQMQPGLPAHGIVALVDLGATGTSITLADTAAGFRSVGRTVRYDEFSGELIDQAVLRQVLTVLDGDPSNTSAVGALSRVREQCRMAKERLSSETATGFTGPLLPGTQSTVRLTRAELEMLLRDPLDGLLAAIEESLQRNNIAHANLAVVATVGGGANIPVVTQRLSSALRVPVTTSPKPQLAAALGAALMAQHGSQDDAVTSLGMAPAAATGPAVALTATAAHTVAASAAVEPLAWSEDQPADDIALSSYSDFEDDQSLDKARPAVQFEHGEGSAMEAPPPLPWHRRPGVLFGAAVCAVLLAAVGLIATSQIGGMPATPVVTTATTTPTAAPVPPPAPAEPQPPAVETVVVQQPAPNPPRRQQAPAPRVATPPPGPSPVTSTTVVTSTVLSTTSVETSEPTPEPTPDRCTPPGCITVPECDPATCVIDGPQPDGTGGTPSPGGNGGTGTPDGTSGTNGGASQGGGGTSQSGGGTSEGGISQGAGGGNTTGSGGTSGTLGTGPAIDCPGYAGCDLPDAG